MAREKKYRMRAYLKETSARRVFSNFGVTFWRGEYTDLPSKLPKIAMEWLENNEHIELERIQISDVVSDAGVKEIQVDVVPVMTPITLKRELGARDALEPGMTEDKMRKVLTACIRKESGVTEVKPNIRNETAEVTIDDSPGEPGTPRYTEEQVRGMSYRELQAALKSLGVSAKGKESILLNRLLKAI